jgi:hypothetical protein
VLDTIPCFVENSSKKKWTRAPVLVVKGRALYLVAAFHLYLVLGKYYDLGPRKGTKDLE